MRQHRGNDTSHVINTSAELSQLVREDTELLNKAISWLKERTACHSAYSMGDTMTILLTGQLTSELTRDIDKYNRCHWILGLILVGGIISLHAEQWTPHLPNKEKICTASRNDWCNDAQV